MSSKTISWKLVTASRKYGEEECARLLALPVVNGDNLLLGVITVDDLVDVVEEETTEEIQRLGGAQPLEKAAGRCPAVRKAYCPRSKPPGNLRMRLSNPFFSERSGRFSMPSS